MGNDQEKKKEKNEVTKKGTRKGGVTFIEATTLGKKKFEHKRQDTIGKRGGHSSMSMEAPHRFRRKKKVPNAGKEGAFVPLRELQVGKGGI